LAKRLKQTGITLFSVDVRFRTWLPAVVRVSILGVMMECRTPSIKPLVASMEDLEFMSISSTLTGRLRTRDLYPVEE
jgi:hypothetical protein